MLFHMSRHEDREVDFYQCNQCQNQFRKKEKLEQHMVKKHGGGFQCETCGRKFPEQSILKEHKRVHTRERPHQCTECGATFSFQSTFISHRKMHLREQGITEEEAKVKLYYFCDICEKSYANKAGLRLHKLHVHEKYSKEVPCDVCGISFRTRELLKQHREREHSSEPKFVCDECGQRFGNSYHLKRHMTSHSDDGFPCSRCSRVFTRKDGLDTHFSHAHRDTVADVTSEGQDRPAHVLQTGPGGEDDPPIPGLEEQAIDLNLVTGEGFEGQVFFDFLILTIVIHNHHPDDQCDPQEDFSLFTVSVDLEDEPSRQFLLPSFEETISLQVRDGGAAGLVGRWKWQMRSGSFV
jgi:hypothetical protein